MINFSQVHIHNMIAFDLAMKPSPYQDNESTITPPPQVSLCFFGSFLVGSCHTSCSHHCGPAAHPQAATDVLFLTLDQFVFSRIAHPSYTHSLSGFFSCSTIPLKFSHAAVCVSREVCSFLFHGMDIPQFTYSFVNGYINLLGLP